MSLTPVQLEYSNPLEDQPEGSDAVVERGANYVAITIPPSGYRSLTTVWYIALSGFIFLMTMLVAAALSEQRESYLQFALVITILILFALAVLVIRQAYAHATLPTILQAEPGSLKITRPSIVRRSSVFKEVTSEKLHMTMGTPGIAVTRIVMIAELRLRRWFVFSATLLGGRPRNELIWIQRQLGKVLDQPVVDH